MNFPARILAGLGIFAFQSACANPSYTPGVWKQINPPGLPFNGNCCGSTSFAQGLAIDPADPSVLYLCVNNFNVTDVGLYKTVDGGSSWNRIGNLPDPLYAGATTILDEPLRIRIDPKNPQHLYCGDGVRGSSGGFWVSTDGGATFAQTEGWKSAAKMPDMDGINDVYDIATDPSDFKHVLVTLHSPFSWASGCGSHCGNAGILESKDGGQTWIIHDPMAGWGYGHSIWFLKNGTTWLLGTQGDGFWRTTNSGDTWTQVSTENIAHGGGQIYYSKTGDLYASSADKVLRSTDDGMHWSKVGTVSFTTGIFGDGENLYTNHAYAGASEPFSVSPESDGVAWTSLGAASGAFTDGPFEMAFDAVNHILYSGNWGNGLIAMKVSPASLRYGPVLSKGNLAPSGKSIFCYDVKGQLAGEAAIEQDGSVKARTNEAGRHVYILNVR